MKTKVTKIIHAKGVLVQFAKAPIVGQVKTRLGSVLTPEQSAQLHQDLVLHTFRMLKSIPQADLALAVSSSEHNFWQEQCFAGLEFWPQPSGDLGERMFACFASYLGKDSVPWMILVGSDCPSIDTRYISDAMEALEQGQQLVLGPAADGGYVLIGMPALLAVFDGVEWGSDAVLAQTRANAQMLGITPYLLEPLADIDRPEDLIELSGYPHLCHWASVLR